MPSHCRAWNILVVSVMVLLGMSLGCSTNPTETKAKHMQRGDRYFKEGRYNEALIEYKNVVQVDPKDPDGHYKLALAYLKVGGLGNVRHGFAELSKTVEFKPDLSDAQLRLGELYLLSGDTKRARERAEIALELEPDSPEGQILLGKSHVLAKELDEGITALRKALELEPKRIATYIDLAVAYLAKHDTASAAHVLSQALQADPTSVTAHIAAGDFALTQQQAAEAEAHYKQAVELQPNSLPLRFRLGKFYTATQKLDQAEATFTEAALLKPEDEAAALALGDFYALIRNVDRARDVYLAADAKHPKSTHPKKKLAQLQLASGQAAAAMDTIEAVLDTNGRDFDALFIQARIYLALNKSVDAIEVLQRILKEEPKSAPAHFLLGVAFVQANDLPQARRELTEAVSIAPGMIQARLPLAALHQKDGSYDLALEQALEILRNHPQHVEAHLAAGDAYFGKKEWEKAREAYQQVTVLAPNVPVGHYKLGLTALWQKRTTEALSHFEAALTKQPSFTEALSAIMSVHVSKGEAQKALERGLAQVKRAPDNAVIYNLLGRAALVTRHQAQAETYFKKSLELDKTLLVSYMDLGRLYLRQNDPRKAVTELEAALAVNPELVQAHTMLGIVHEGLKEFDKAKASYERALQLSPKFAPAANNLAWLYAEQGGNIDTALALAQTAREQRPQDPLIADTLGWLYYKKHAYLRAISLLKEAAEQASDNPLIQYHLGMAYHQQGQKDLARKSLQVSLKLSASYPGAEEAKKVLGEL
jgi:tetratricopeptide (TPR) repeat protein